MGFLHKLWDETLAGPTPETGLAKLRKYDPFKLSSSPTSTSTSTASSQMMSTAVTRRSASMRSTTTSSYYINNDNTVPISRSITIVRTSPSSSASVSPNSSSASTPVSSPGTPSAEFKGFMRRKKVGSTTTQNSGFSTGKTQ